MDGEICGTSLLRIGLSGTVEDYFRSISLSSFNSHSELTPVVGTGVASTIIETISIG